MGRWVAGWAFRLTREVREFREFKERQCCTVGPFPKLPKLLNFPIYNKKIESLSVGSLSS